MGFKSLFRLKRQSNSNPFTSTNEVEDGLHPPPPAVLNSTSTQKQAGNPFVTPPRTPSKPQEVRPSSASQSSDTPASKTKAKGPSYRLTPLSSQPTPVNKDDTHGAENELDIETASSNDSKPEQNDIKKKRSCGNVRGFWRYIDSRVSLKAIWDLLNPLEYFWPITFKKYFVLLLIGCAVAGIYFSNYYFNWIRISMNMTREYMLPVLILVIGLEPLMFLIILAASTLPANDLPSDIEKKRLAKMAGKEKLPDPENPPVDPSGDSFVAALVLPCHNSDRDALRRAFESAYPYFRPQDIFVVDNGRTRHPSDMSFRDWAKAEHPDIHYIWSPIGSKNAAQLVGALAAKDYQYILTTDDDVSLPPNYRHPTHLIDESVKGVAFPLAGINSEGDCPLFLVAWQDCEYRMSGLTKLAESNLCGVCFPHGAGWFVEREVLVELLAAFHPTDFIAEDVNSGFCLMKMKKRIAFDFRVVLATEVPTTLLGPELNWFKQRIKSWEMGRHKMLVTFLRRFFALNGQDTMTGFLAQKAIMLYNIATIFVDWIRIPVFVTMGYSGLFWFKAALMTLASVVPLLLYNYIKCWSRPEMRVRLVAAITYPIYKQLYALVSVLRAVRCVTFYIGGYVKAKPIYKMIEDGDDECFWLYSRFDSNPGWLVDEREEMLRAEVVLQSEEEEHRRADEKERERQIAQTQEARGGNHISQQELNNMAGSTDTLIAPTRSFWRRGRKRQRAEERL